MSRKIPLEKTIGGAYGFLFSNFLSIVGIVWFPLVVFGGLAGAAIWYGAIAHPLPPFRFTREPQEFVRTNLPFFFALGRITGPLFLSALFFGVMTITGLTRRALGQMDRPTFIYFNLGGSFWRMLLAIFLAVVLIVLLRIAMHIVAFAWLHFGAPLVPQGIAMIVNVLGGLTLFVVFVYTVVRLIFLLPAVVMAEGGIGIGRAWSLGGGNSWRAFVSLVAVALPPAIVFGVVFGILVGGLMSGFPMPPFVGQDHPDPEAVVVWLHKFVPFALNALKANWPILVGVQLLYSVVRTSLFAGASANAYRGVTADAG